MRLGIVFTSVVVVACGAQQVTHAHGPGTCCYKRTFGYDQVWTPQPASPQVMAQSLMMACPDGPCDGSLVPAVVGSAELYAGAVMMPTTVLAPPAPTFRLCVACPPNASVIIDGQKTKAGDRLRQYQLNLSEEKPDRSVEVIVLQGDQDILWKDAIAVKAGGTKTIVVPSKKLQVQTCSVKTRAPASPGLDDLKERLDAIEEQMSAIDKGLKRIEALQPEKLKQKARYLYNRQKLQDERQEIQDERQSFQMEMGEILQARDSALKDKVAEADAKQVERDKMQDARDQLQQRRDGLQTERDQLQQRRDKLQGERDTQQVSRETDYASKQKSLKDQTDKNTKMQTERDQMQDARDKLQRERDALQQARDKLQNERDTLQRARDKH